MTTTDSRTASDVASPIGNAPSGSDSLNGQFDDGTHTIVAVEGQTSPQAIYQAPPMDGSPAGSKTAPPAIRRLVSTGEALEGHKTSQDQARLGNHSHHVLADPLLALAADVLDDLERVRIANENRLRQLTRNQVDSDGVERGFGLDQAHPDVARLAALVEMLTVAEHQATLNLSRTMRANQLGPWVKSTAGVGEKQGARLIAAIGDPYWNTLHERPRQVGELWSYCGYGDAREQVRRRGQKANWSADAKMRAYLVAESCMKKRSSPYRAVYDAGRAKYAEAVHASECVRCGPSGKPAQPGSALSDGHKHARALRAVAKEILRDLWHEARDIHEDPEGKT